MIVFQYSETACLQGFKQKGVTYREPPLNAFKPTKLLFYTIPIHCSSDPAFFVQ